MARAVPAYLSAISGDLASRQRALGDQHSNILEIVLGAAMSKPTLYLAFTLTALLVVTAGWQARSQTAPVNNTQKADETIVLPTVEVTSPSPITKPNPAAQIVKDKPQPVANDEPAPVPKPKKKSASAVPEPQPVVKQAQAPKPVQSDIGAAQPETVSVPGTLLVVDDAFVAVTVTTARELEATQGQTITNTLAQKPGISASTFAAGASRPIVRGLDNNRVRVQEDGIGSHDVSALSEDHAVPIDPYAADRVEVVRGPATLRYGSQAIGGVVSVENERIPTFAPPNGISGQIADGYSSIDDGRDGAFKATAGVNGIVVHADAFKRQSEDYGTPLGRQANTFVDSEGFSVGSSLVGNDGFAGAAFVHFESLYGIPGELTRIDMNQDKILSKGEWRVHSSGIDAIRFWFGATDYAHNEVSPEGDIGSRFTNKEQEGRVEIQHLPFLTSFGEVSGAAGVQIDHRKVTGLSFGGDNLLEPATSNVAAGFWFEELQVSKPLRLQAATRVEKTDISGVGIEDPLGAALVMPRDRSFTPVSGSLGALYELPMGVVARLTGQYVERAPDAPELFSKGAHDATATFEIGNPELTKEKASTIELGLKRANGAFRFDTSAYYTHYKGFIYKQLSGVLCGGTLASCGVEEELKQLVFQQRDATFYGVEIAAQYDVAPVWNGVWGFDGQYDFVHAEFDGGENVPRIPPQRLGGGLYYRDGNWFARTGVLHAFNQNRTGANETPTFGYTLVSAELSYTDKLNGYTGAATEYTIGIKGENLADDEVRNHSSFKKDEVLQPGASVRVFGSLKLN